MNPLEKSVQLSTPPSTTQEVFAHAAFSTLKTMVMMIGEIDFGDMLGAGVTHAGIPPSFHMPYPAFTVLFFTMFVIFIPILLTNLMVGLSVDKIHKVSSSAVAMPNRIIPNIQTKRQIV